MTVPATRYRQEVEIVLEAQDSWVRIQLPGGRAATIYGNGQLNVVIGTQTYYHRLPRASEPSVSASEPVVTQPAVVRAPSRPDPRSAPGGVRDLTRFQRSRNA